MEPAVAIAVLAVAILTVGLTVAISLLLDGRHRRVAPERHDDTIRAGAPKLTTQALLHSVRLVPSRG